MHRMIQLLEKRHRFKIFTPTEPVAEPLARFASVIEIQHGRHGIDPQSIDVELLDPVQRVRQQEIADFVARVVEDVRPPLGVIAQSRILVFVAGGAVKATQCPVVLRKMRRHPVQQHTDARHVHRIHERAEIIG